MINLLSVLMTMENQEVADVLNKYPALQQFQDVFPEGIT